MQTAFKLNPPPPTPPTAEIESAVRHLSELLTQHYGQETCYTLELRLEPDLRVEQVLQDFTRRLSATTPKQENLVDRIRQRIRSQVGDLSSSQIERMVDSALHGVGVHIGMIIGSESSLTSSRRKIHACPLCDEVFIDEDSLNRHLPECSCKQP